MDPRILKSVNRMRVLSGQRPITIEENDEMIKNEVKARINTLFSGKLIADEIFNVLYSNGVCDTILWAERVRGRKIKDTLNLLLQKIYIFSSQWDLSGQEPIYNKEGPIWKKTYENLTTDKIPNEVLKIHKELRRMLKEDHRLSNFLFCTYLVLAYFTLLAYSAGSIQPGNLWNEFNSHISAVVEIAKYISRFLILIGSLYASSFTYEYLNKKINGDQPQRSSRSGPSLIAAFIGIITFILAFSILTEGINGTFHIKIFETAQKVEDSE